MKLKSVPWSWLEFQSIQTLEQIVGQFQEHQLLICIQTFIILSSMCRILAYPQQASLFECLALETSETLSHLFSADTLLLDEEL